ncbi:MAG TPA: ribulose phosphate epimerase [Nannocystaceae bacterium]|nr:ribulose phosphate epimerase [Nannocystaceae bacterium]
MATQTRPFLVIAVLLGCGDRVYDLGAPIAADGESSSGASATDGVIDEPEQPSPTTIMSSSDDGSDDDDPHAEGIGFIEEHDGGGHSWECSLFEQDCPTGEKCNIYANDGGNSWNATRCFPIDPDPDAIGEPCTVIDNGVSGMDSCELGAMCWYVDPETNTGECVAFCQGSEANPVCADPNTHCEGRDITLCLPSCCPLEQTCNEGLGCYPVNDTFSCAPDASGELGAYGDPCEFINVCDPYFFCGAPEHVPGCEGSYGCCNAMCLVGSLGCSAYSPLLTCVPWFEEGQAPPGYENVGACLIAE